MSHPLGMLAAMEQRDDELTPEALDEWQRSMTEVERLSRACVAAARWNWGGAPADHRSTTIVVRLPTT